MKNRAFLFKLDRRTLANLAALARRTERSRAGVIRFLINREIEQSCLQPAAQVQAEPPKPDESQSEGRQNV